MARGRNYKGGVFDTSTWLPTGAANAGTTTLPILYWATSANSDMNIFNVSVGVMGVGTIPSNASVTWSINTVTGTKAGGNAVTVTQLSGVAKASLLTAISTAGGTSAAAITALTATTAWWNRVTPFAAGANWEDVVTYGDEINIPVSTTVALCVTPTSAGTSTTFFAEIEWSE